MDKIPLSDTPSKRSSLSIDAINKKIEASPVIYVESPLSVKVSGSLIIIGGQEYQLETMTVFDVVVAIRGAGGNAWLTSETVAMLPAIMLSDFSNKNTIVSKLQSSPHNLLLDSKPYIGSVLSISDISYNVLKLYSLDKKDIPFEALANKVYSDIDDSAKIMYELAYNKYVMYAQNGKVINGKDIFNNTIGLKSIYINETNKNDNK